MKTVVLIWSVFVLACIVCLLIVAADDRRHNKQATVWDGDLKFVWPLMAVAMLTATVVYCRDNGIATLLGVAGMVLMMAEWFWADRQMDDCDCDAIDIMRTDSAWWCLEAGWLCCWMFWAIVWGGSVYMAGTVAGAMMVSDRFHLGNLEVGVLVGCLMTSINCFCEYG